MTRWNRALPGVHPGVELIDRQTAGADKNKRQHCVQHAGDSCEHHATTEAGRIHQVLPVAFAYGLRVLGEKSA